MIYNKILLVTKAVNPRYRLSAIPSNLKNNLTQLNFKVKKYIFFKTDQEVDSPI